MGRWKPVGVYKEWERRRDSGRRGRERRREEKIEGLNGKVAGGDGLLRVHELGWTVGGSSIGNWRGVKRPVVVDCPAGSYEQGSPVIMQY